MDFSHLHEPALTASIDLLVLVVFGDPSKDSMFKAVDTATKGGLREAARTESFEGKTNQSLVFWTAGTLKARRVLVLGGGNRGELNVATLRDLGASAAQCANRTGSESLGFIAPALGARQLGAVGNLVEGAILGTYKFARYLTSEDSKKTPALRAFGVFTDPKGAKIPVAVGRAVAAAIARAQVIAAAVNHARDFVNEPAAYMTPVQLAAEAHAIVAKHASLSIEVHGPETCAELGMGMFLAVGQGSEQEARLIHITYKPAKKAKKKIALIGKGVTFDSGGYSLKPSNAMEDMKVDMSGAAAVISAMDAIAQLGSDHEIHAIAACCENLVSGKAYKLGDVLKSMDGTTVEINNTDAEGRLTLGDAITYARTKVAPDEMFDFATLTGACMVALGPYTSGVMSDHAPLVKGWLEAADHAGEDMWRLPLNPRLREQLKSNIADMRNTGDRFGGAITAGLFLKVFAKDTAWVHVDIAGPASLTTARPHQPRGGSGVAVASIVEYAAKR